MLIGILGGGQLARMMALAAYPLNIRTRVYEPAAESCAAQVTERIQGEYDDYRTLYEFIRDCDAITYEFENVPMETAHWIAERKPVYPPPEALRVSQDRIVEKCYFQDSNIPLPPFRAVDSRAEFESALQEIGFPCVLKTRRFGYDGKGQMLITDPAEREKAWELLGGRPLILEQFVKFDREVSFIAVFDRQQNPKFYPLIENHHRAGILRKSIALADRNEASKTIHQLASEYATTIGQRLNYTGVLTIEFFEVAGRLYANEMAPRVHNSGHWTIEGAGCSQFENHMRAVAAFPLGQTHSRGHSTMYNFIGDIPHLSLIGEVLEGEASIHYHHYGKTARANRKVGHVTLQAEQAEDLEKINAAFLKRVYDAAITVE